MVTCGIICEYNPFHNGHEYQIKTIKGDYCDSVVCVMSGNYVQRAVPACQDKRVRAKNALAGGADLVLELPFPFSSMSASGFANAGIKILAGSGICSHFAFGSECGDVLLLSETAKILNGDFMDNVKHFQRENPSLGFAAARCALLEEKYGKQYADVLKNPNDILAVEYIRANNTLPTPMTPIALKRKTPFDGRDDDFASSSYIRSKLNALCNDKENDIKPELFDMPSGSDLSTLSFNDLNFFGSMQICLMLKQPSELEKIAEVSRGAEHSIIINALSRSNYDEMCRALASKSFTDAKIRRMLLFSFLGVDKSYMKCDPEYTFVLACNETGKALLRNSRPARKLIVASRISHVKASDDAFKQFLLAKRSEGVLEKCRSNAI